MKLHQSRAGEANLFTAYGEDYVAVNHQRIGKSIVVLPDRIIEDWSATSFDALSPADIELLVTLGCEIVVLGTGNKLRFPRPEVLAPLFEGGTGVEVMDLRAACRTYNILVAEGRKAAAALLFD